MWKKTVCPAALGFHWDCSANKNVKLCLQNCLRDATITFQSLKTIVLEHTSQVFKSIWLKRLFILCSSSSVLEKCDYLVGVQPVRYARKLEPVHWSWCQFSLLHQNTSRGVSRFTVAAASLLETEHPFTVSSFHLPAEFNNLWKISLSNQTRPLSPSWCIIFITFSYGMKSLTLFPLSALSSVPTTLHVGAVVVFILSPVAHKVEYLHIHSFKGIQNVTSWSNWCP